MTINLHLIGRYASDNGAEIPAFDSLSKRLFVIAGDVVEILDLANVSTPNKIGDLPLDTTAVGIGFELVPNSVAVGKKGTVSEGIVAVSLAIKETATGNQARGEVQFFNTATGAFLGKQTVGFLPDMVTFTPDGTKVLTANEGEPSEDYSFDPEGSVSIINLSNGVANATIEEATFTAFNSQVEQLRASGVRIFGPNATVAQDVEPEYITFSGDGTKAWVTLQENNAIAVVDIATATVEAIKPLGFKDYSSNTSKLETYEINNLPPIGTTIGNQEILLGGFSGLFFEGKTADGKLKFVTHTDRGPNGDATGSLRPFLLPEFSPEIVRFELNQATGEVTITDRISIKQADGTPITGLPNINIPNGTGSTPYNDEIPVDLNNNVISPLDRFGADTEAIVVAEDGTFWMTDEYRPAIYHFNPDGTLIDRFVPQGTGVAAGGNAGDFGTEALPAVLGQRRQNRGFEGLALNPDNNKLYAFVQSPIRNPQTLNNTALNNLNNIRIVEFDLTTKTTTAEYLYPMDNPNLGTPGNTRADKIGDAVYIGNGEFLVVERDDDAIDSDPSANIEKKVYRFNLNGATNITNQSAPIDLGGGVLKTVDQMTPEELTSQGINLVKKNLYVDLNQAGYNTVEKVEGLAYMGNNTIAVINDNDFRVADITLNGDGTFSLNDGYIPEPITLGILQVQSNGLDGSDRDNAINIRNWPVYGMYMPDAIASYTFNGETYYVTANEGDSRVRPTADGILEGINEGAIYNEEVRIGNNRYVLDPTVFPNATDLKRNANLGRLYATNTLGDTDGDGDFDKIYTFGARSFSIWDSQGNLVFDSGDDIERITAQAFPANFNANNTNNTFDDRSDNKGPEPEGLAVGTIKGQTYAFIGLERIGGVMVYNVTNPNSPEFVQYINTRDFTQDPRSNLTDSGPEGLTFIKAQDSPNGKPLLIVSNEVSKTTNIFEIEVPQTNFTLQILHASDEEAGIPALQDAIGFSAVMNALDAQYANTLKLTSGDLFIAGPFFNASQDLYTRQGIADILIHNELGWDAAAVGNHEFDAGTSAFYNAIAPNANIKGVGIDPNTGFTGANFPYLATNLDYSTDSSNLKNLVVPPAEAPKPASLTKSVVVDVNGEQVGVIGAVVPYLPQIANIGAITMLTDPNSRDIETNAQLIADSVQPFVDELVAKGINKIVLMTHLQQFEIEQALASKLRNVDILMGGGSHRVMANAEDALRQDETQTPPELLQPYPQVFKDADGKDIYLVNTAANYRYVGRLIVDFDPDGNIIRIGDDSGAYATDIAGVDGLYEEDITTFEQVKAVADPELVAIVDHVGEFINSKDSNIFGNTAVWLNGLRSSVRSEETNLGNLTADANLWYAEQYGFDIDISVKNGGGIRDQIGVSYIDGGTNELIQLPPQANPAVGKEEGDVSQLDIENSLRFNNKLSVADISAQGIKDLAEHFVAQWREGATPGQFGQIGGFSFSFDPDNTPIEFTRDSNGLATGVAVQGQRIQNLVLNRPDGTKEAIVLDGELVVNPDRTYKMVILDFLATGGDGYPVFYFKNVVKLDTLNPNGLPNNSNLPAGAEQDALAEYLAEFYPTADQAFDQPDTPIAEDTRIQNLNFRNDSLLNTPVTINVGNNGGSFNFANRQNDLIVIGGDGDDNITTGSGRDRIDAGRGNNIINAGAGDDVIIGSGRSGVNNQINGGEGFDTVIYDGAFADFPIKVENGVVTVGTNTDVLTNIEQLEFKDRTVLVEDLINNPTDPTDPTNPTNPIETLLNDPFFRFQNSDRPGTYIYAGEAESQNIRQNFPQFVQEGLAFKVSEEADERLMRFYRFQNMAVPGSYLYAGEAESQNIRQNFLNFKEEGIAFYALDGNANVGVDIYRLQNTQLPGTYIFVAEEEKNNILANFPQFTLEGVAFEVVV